MDKHWRTQPAKDFLKGSSAKLWADLLDHDAKTVWIMVDLLTGDCRLNRDLSLIGVEENNKCKFCLEKEETATQVLGACEGMSRMHFRVVSSTTPEAMS